MFIQRFCFTSEEFRIKNEELRCPLCGRFLNHARRAYHHFSLFILHSSLLRAGNFPVFFPCSGGKKYWFLNLTLYHRFFPRSSLKNVQKRPISSVGFRHISRIALFNCIHANFPCFFCEIMIKFSVKKYANNWGKPVFF